MAMTDTRPDLRPRRDLRTCRRAPGRTGPVRTAIVGDVPVTTGGVAALLAPYGDIAVQVLPASSPLRPVDVALVDPFLPGNRLEPILEVGLAHRVAVYAWNVRAPLVARALQQGCRGYLSKHLAGEALARAIVRIDMGEVVVAGGRDAPGDDWAGRHLGLTRRESDVLELASRGHTWTEVADLLFLSINSVKTHTRSLYRRIGVTNKGQAVLWGVHNGFGVRP